MNPLSGNEISTESYSVLYTRHNTMKAGEYWYRSLTIMIYVSKKNT